MRKTFWLAMVAVLVLALGCVGVAHAEIIPPHGFGQIGLQAVVLCEELTLREKPNAASGIVQTLKYGKLPIVIEQQGGWAYCAVDDSEDSPLGWVNSDYLAIDPAWYRTEQKTTVYAWNNTAAPKVALLNAGVKLPILKQDGSWIVVSLRGASGWIHK